MRCSCGGVPREPANPIVSIDRPDEQFQWGGCSDDVKFGLEFSQAFVEAAISAGKPSKSSGNKAKSKPSKKTLMNHHNYRVGRKVLFVTFVAIDNYIK
jgi:wnt family